MNLDLAREAMRFAPALALGAAASFAPLIGRWLGLAGFFAGILAAPWLDAALPGVSFTLVQLAALRLLAPTTKPRVATSMLVVLAVAGPGYFVAALGLGSIDPYDFGFHPRLALGVLGVLGLGLAFAGEWAAMALLTGDLLAYALGFYANLLDALVDPVLSLLVFIALGARVWRYLRMRRGDSRLAP